MTKKPIIKTSKTLVKKPIKKVSVKGAVLVKKTPVVKRKSRIEKPVVKKLVVLQASKETVPKKIGQHNFLFGLFAVLGVIFSLILLILIRVNLYYDAFQPVLKQQAANDQERFVNRLAPIAKAIDPAVSGIFITNNQQPLWTQEDSFLGNLRAPVKIFYFADFNSQESRDQEKILRKLVADYPDQILLVRKDFPADNPISIQGARAARCAGEQGDYWVYHDLLLAYLNRGEDSTSDVIYNSEASSKSNQLQESRSFLSDLAVTANLNAEAFNECFRGASQPIIIKNVAEGESLGISSVPTIYVNGQQFSTSLSYEDLERLVKLVISQ
ncbi:MAG: DsbA family protein [Patescibacteria group bacterium]